LESAELRASGPTRPSGPTPIVAADSPQRERPLQASWTEGCSIAETATRPRPERTSTLPRAMAFASVAPEQSVAEPPDAKEARSRERASSRARFARTPAEWAEEGFA